MSDQEKISDIQYAYLLFSIVVATIVLFVPQVLAKEAGRSAWLVSLFIPPMGSLISLFTALKLSQRFPGMSLSQYTEVILGKILAKAIGIVYLFYLVLGSVVIIREYTDFINITMFPNTPRLVLILTAVIIGSYTATKRLEVIVRATQFVLPLFIAFSILILLSSIPDMEPGNLLPLFEGGLAPIIRGSIVPTYWFGEVGFLVLLLPVVNKPKELKIKGIITIVIISVFITMETMATIMVFGIDVTKVRLFPFWALSTYVQFQNYIHRVESFLVMVWLGLIYIKIALFSYMALKTTLQVFGLKSLKWVQLFLAGIEALAAMLFFNNISDLQIFSVNFLSPFGLCLEIIIPILLLIIAFFRKSRKA